MYALGIDLGTTFTAAATWRNGHAEIASARQPGGRHPVGRAAARRRDVPDRRGRQPPRPDRTAPGGPRVQAPARRHDPDPARRRAVLGRGAHGPAAAARSSTRWPSARAARRPAICVSHPANWGPYKTDLLLQAVRLAGLEEPVSFTTEPEAAAVFYAQQQRIEPGAIVAVYDLGGGTFDAAVLRKTAVGFEILGRPEGIERLGGIDFDAAVFSHVARALGGKLDELDEDDPTAIAAVARLRDECVQAKEALSSDTDVSIPVLLPNLSTEVRLTRAELEAMVRPGAARLDRGAEAGPPLGRTSRPDQLHSVLLVGGSSRMPIVAQLVGAELGRPVAVDAHPKHAVALGAAWLASGALSTAPSPRAVNGAPPAAVPVAGSADAPPTTTISAMPPATKPAPAPNPAPAPAAASAAGGGFAVGTASVGAAPVRAPQGGSVYGGAPTLPPGRPPGRSGGSGGSGGPFGKHLPLIAVAAAVLLVLVGGGVALALTLGNGNGGQNPAAQPTTQPAGSEAPPTSAAAPVIPPDELCSDAIKANPRWVCLTSATMTNDELRIEYEFEDNGNAFSISRGFHLHIYGASADGSDPPASVMGSHSNNQGSWYVEDKQPSVHRNGGDQYDVVGDSPKVCARIAQSAHRLVPDVSGQGTFVTGNCVPVTRA